ncbi:MAG: PDZ domain-containing protein [Verrucomicrobia bacterium]|nr:PDZ domain-containing protein [Verrucomicrobiota bacterium]MCH8528411.1 PDZ domain-containing protein [Kiritimatiellia bacterium]
MRKRTVIELSLIVPLLFVGIHVWQRGFNRPVNPNPPEENEEPSAHRVQDLIRRTPSAPPAPGPATAPTPPPALETPQPSLVTLQVLEADGSIPVDAVLVFSPDGSLYESAPLGLLTLSADPGTLTLQASATDGAALRLSEAHTLRLEPGERHTLQIRLPPAERPHADPGFALLPGEDYALITEILPGSPAQLAGLQPGDAVIAVDGVPTASLNAEQLETLLFGPQDEPVRLSLILQHDNGEFEEVEALVNRLTTP